MGLEEGKTSLDLVCSAVGAMKSGNLDDALLRVRLPDHEAEDEDDTIDRRTSIRSTRSCRSRSSSSRAAPKETVPNLIAKVLLSEPLLASGTAGIDLPI